MGLLDRAVVRQARKNLAAHLRPDEEILHRDIAEEASTTLLPPGPRRRLDVVATDRGVYFMAPGGRLLSSVTYDAIAYAASLRGKPVADRLELVAHNRETVALWFPKKDDGLGSVIQRQLLRLPPIKESREIGDGHVTLTYHPWRPDVMSYWCVDVGGIDDARSPEARVSIEGLRAHLGEKILGAAAGAPLTDAPRWSLTHDWMTRDWTEAVQAMLGYLGEPTECQWTYGDLIAGDGSSQGAKVLAANATSVHLIEFESMRPLLLADRSNHVMSVPFHRIADWELRAPEPTGHVLMRLLELDDELLALPTLADALKVGSGYRLTLLGLRPADRSPAFADAVVNAIQNHGAYEPGGRADHPLQQ